MGNVPLSYMSLWFLSLWKLSLWDLSLYQKFEPMKSHVKKTIVLSPFDMEKDIHLHTDASNAGISFILSQPQTPAEDNTKDHYRRSRNIITLGSAGLTPAQERCSTGEQECLAVYWSVVKCDYYLKHSKRIIVHSDNKNL